MSRKKGILSLKQGKNPKSPIPINDSASFRALATELIEDGMLDEERPSQFVALARYVQLLHHWLELNSELSQGYTQEKFDKHGNASEVALPQVNMMLAFGRQLESLEKTLGLTPESRHRILQLSDESGDDDGIDPEELGYL